jgi:alkanesulfonate monooxygenase SsuD/methylene tetrahydromethanopterin reductase-like flavin-dependent oxidoreductase (luciferase family)
VQDTDEKALELGREFMWMQGEFTGIGHPYWTSPSGYGSPSRRLDVTRIANTPVSGAGKPPYEDQLATHEIVAGSPETVIEQLRGILEVCRPSILMLWGNDGKVGHADSKRCIELLGKEVVPALREIGKELGLNDPFEIDAPVSLDHRRQLAGQPA